MSSTVLGIIAALLLMGSFALRGEKKIRLVNMVGCVFLILFAINLQPGDGDELRTARIIMVLMGAATLLVHCGHFWYMYKEAKAERALAKAEARAAEAEAKVEAQQKVGDKNNIE